MLANVCLCAIVQPEHALIVLFEQSTAHGISYSYSESYSDSDSDSYSYSYSYLACSWLGACLACSHAQIPIVCSHH